MSMKTRLAAGFLMACGLVALPITVQMPEGGAGLPRLAAQVACASGSCTSVGCQPGPEACAILPDGTFCFGQPE